MRVGAPFVKYGEQTRHFLQNTLGFSSEKVDKLLSSRAVSSTWCEVYIPHGDPRKRAKRDRSNASPESLIKKQKSMTTPPVCSPVLSSVPLSPLPLVKGISISSSEAISSSSFKNGKVSTSASALSKETSSSDVLSAQSTPCFQPTAGMNC